MMINLMLCKIKLRLNPFTKQGYHAQTIPEILTKPNFLQCPQIVEGEDSEGVRRRCEENIRTMIQSVSADHQRQMLLIYLGAVYLTPPHVAFPLCSCWLATLLNHDLRTNSCVNVRNKLLESIPYAMSFKIIKAWICFYLGYVLQNLDFITTYTKFIIVVKSLLFPYLRLNLFFELFTFLKLVIILTNIINLYSVDQRIT